MLIGHTEITLRRLQGEFAELHGYGIVQTKALAQVFTIRLGSIFANHLVDGITDELEHEKGTQGHDGHDRDSLQQASDQECNHRLVP